jgi:26S proteasome regulatory subunit N8
MAQALTVKTNDQMLVLYVSALIRAVASLHTLIDNKVSAVAHECRSVAHKCFAWQIGNREAEAKAANGEDKDGGEKKQDDSASKDKDAGAKSGGKGDKA